MNLLETLVALLLTALLVAILTTGLLTIAQKDESPWPLLEEYACRQRLTQVLPELTAPFQLDGDDLLFSFNNGVDDESPYCGQVLGRLFIEGGKLLLTLQPDPDRWPLQTSSRTEILLADTAHLSFRFFDIPDHEWSQTPPDDLPALIELSTDHFTATYAPLEANKAPRYFK